MGFFCDILWERGQWCVNWTHTASGYGEILRIWSIWGVFLDHNGCKNDGVDTSAVIVIITIVIAVIVVFFILFLYYYY